MRIGIGALGLLLCVQTARGGAAELTFPLSPAEVRCSEMQLARVQRRLASVGAGNIPFTLGTSSLWHRSAAGSSFTGLVRLLNNGGNGWQDFAQGKAHFGEADLAFDLVFTAKASVLDPRQPPAPQATLVRRDPGTNLVLDHQGCDSRLGAPADLSCPMVLDFDLSAVPGDSVNPKTPLVINSAAAAAPGFTGPLASPLPAASGEGPGIADDLLDQACGGTLTEFDTHVFEILARTIVPSTCFTLGDSICGNAENPGGVDPEGFNLAIFRAADPHLYRVNIYPYQYLCEDNGDCYSIAGPFALELRVNWDAQGRLTNGSVRVLPKCRAGQTLDCSIPFVFSGNLGIVLVPPIFPGQEEEEPSAFRGAPYLDLSPVRSQQVLAATINWAKLLQGTALNQP
jgi:hypothetical protein